MKHTEDLRETSSQECRPVYRYTVDNRYGDDVVILVVAPLVHGVTFFTDNIKDWDDEELKTGRPVDLLKALDIPGEGAPIETDLQPGRVFLRGRFKEVPPPPKKPIKFEVTENAPLRWLRIDQLPLAKDPVKRLYSKLLVRPDSDD